jgi:hypothetical protein
MMAGRRHSTGGGGPPVPGGVGYDARIALRDGRLGIVICSLLQAGCVFLVAGRRLAREF